MTQPAPKIHLDNGYRRASCRNYGNVKLSADLEQVTCRRCMGETGPKRHPYRPVETNYPRYPLPDYCGLCGLSLTHGFGCDGKAERRTVERRAS